MKPLDNWWQGFATEGRLENNVSTTAQNAFYLGAMAVLSEVLLAMQQDASEGLRERLHSLLNEILDYNEVGTLAVMMRVLRPSGGHA